MLLEYALQTILILPSAVALLLATCLLSLQLFVVPLHFLPDAVVTRLRRSPACYASDSSLVKAYDFVVVGGTLASHVWFMRLRKQHPKATILLLEPPLLDYRSLIFTFFAGLDIGVRHDVPYFRAYPFYRASSSTELTANQKEPYVRSVIHTFEVLIKELARDLAAHEDPAIKLPCYRIVQRIDPTSIEKGALSCRHVFPIQYSGLRNAQNVKVLLGVESITWLGYTRDRRLAVQVDIQNQDQPFVFYVNRDLHLFDTVNATGSTEPSIQEHQFDHLTDHQENDDEDDDEDGKVGNSLHQRFYAFRRMSVEEDGFALWTFDLAEEFDGDPSSDPTSAIEILVGFGAGTSHTAEKEEFFETATSFKVLPLAQVTDGWVGLEIQQTVYNDSKHHLMHWGYEMIQRVFDGLNSDGIMDIHSDTASVNTVPQSPGLSPAADQEPFAQPVRRHSDVFSHARVHRPTVDHLIVRDDNDAQQRLPSYLARIWNLVFVDNNHHVSELLADPAAAEKNHPFSAKFARLLQSRACFRSKEDPAVLRSTVVQSCELNQQPLEEDDEDDEDEGRHSSYGPLSDLEGSYQSADAYHVVQQEEGDEEDDDDGVSTSEEYLQTSSSASSTSDGSVMSEASYDNSADVSYANSENEEEEEDDDDDDDEEQEEKHDGEEHCVDDGEDDESQKVGEEDAYQEAQAEPEPESMPEEETDYYEELEPEEQDAPMPKEEDEHEAMAEEFVEQLREEEQDEAHPVEPEQEDAAPVIEAPAVNNEEELHAADDELRASERVEQERQGGDEEYFSDAVEASTVATTAEEPQPVEEERSGGGGKKKKKTKKQKKRS